MKCLIFTLILTLILITSCQKENNELTGNLIVNCSIKNPPSGFSQKGKFYVNVSLDSQGYQSVGYDSCDNNSRCQFELLYGNYYVNAAYRFGGTGAFPQSFFTQIKGDGKTTTINFKLE